MSDNLPATTTGTKLVGRLGERYGVEPDKLLDVLRMTVFKVKDGEPQFSNEELAAGLIIADKYNLDPFCKELYLTRAHGKLLVIVPIDGWAKTVNAQPTYEGCEFEWIEDENGKLKACRCIIHRSDRKYPIKVEEFLNECYQEKKIPWQKWPRRMLRHKAFNQCARLAYPLGGVVDEDEAARYVEVKELSSTRPKTREMTMPVLPATVTRRQPPVTRGGVVRTAEAERQATLRDGRPNTGTGADIPGPWDNDETERRRAARTWSGDDQKRPEPEPQEKGPETAEETAPEDPERAGLKKSFDELYQAHVAHGNDPGKLFGVKEDAGDTLSIVDLLDMTTIMGEQLAEVAT